MTATKNSTINFVEIMLSCASWQEAQRVVDHLLARRLIGAAEFVPIKTKSWQTKVGNNGDVKLIMESAAEYRDKVEAEVAKLHGYESAVLQTTPIARLSQHAAAWLEGKLHATTS